MKRRDQVELSLMTVRELAELWADDADLEVRTERVRAAGYSPLQAIRAVAVMRRAEYGDESALLDEPVLRT